MVALSGYTHNFRMFMKTATIACHKNCEASANFCQYAIAPVVTNVKKRQEITSTYISCDTPVRPPQQCNEFTHGTVQYEYSSSTCSMRVRTIPTKNLQQVLWLQAWHNQCIQLLYSSIGAITTTGLQLYAFNCRRTGLSFSGW